MAKVRRDLEGTNMNWKTDNKFQILQDDPVMGNDNDDNLEGSSGTSLTQRRPTADPVVLSDMSSFSKGSLF